MPDKIGFIGLGAMGKPMAANLLKKGFPLRVFDIRKEPMEELGRLGAKSARSPKEVAGSSEVVITILEELTGVQVRSEETKRP